MSEIIESISEGNFNDGAKEYPTWYEGFIIKTDKQEIKLGIANFQSCCENWGFFMTNDDLEDFVGATISEIKIVDECLNVEQAPEVYEGDVMFVNIETSVGTLQFTAYNEHNGYYSHEAVVISENFNTSEYL